MSTFYKHEFFIKKYKKFKKKCVIQYFILTLHEITNA